MPFIPKDRSIAPMQMVMNRLTVVLLLAFPINLLLGQDPCASLNYHAFRAESFSGTYTDLGALGTDISVSGLDDGISGPQEIGFAFKYHCDTFTQFIFNTNGFIKLGVETTPKTNLFFSNAQSTSGGVFNNADSNNVNLIVAFNNDLESATGLPEFKVYTGGTAPYRVCTIQWKNMREWSSDPATKQYIDMDFQIKLYETTNVIEFVYGDWGPSANPSNYKTAACGLKGKSNADDQLLVVVKSSAAFWNDVTFHNGNYLANESFNFGNPPDRPKPDPGRTYRFTPTTSDDLTVRQVYTMGQSSSYYSPAQIVSANIRNSGFNTRSQIPVYLDVSGAVTFRDTQYIPQLAFMQDARVSFEGFDAHTAGLCHIEVAVGTDDSESDNTQQQTLESTALQLNYATNEPPSGAYGFLSGVQGIYYNRYPVEGSASITSVNAFIADNLPSVGKTVFGIVLNASGQVLARSDNYILQESDLGQWHEFTFPSPPAVQNSFFYAGMGMTSSLTEFAPLGVQSETPLRPNTYYTSFVNGTGLKPIDTTTFTWRFMIGATLNGTPPMAGTASGNAEICAYESASFKLEGYTGFIKWQSSLDGLTSWLDVTDGTGTTSPQYFTAPLTSTTFYRAQVFQPGYDAVYSNIVKADVTPSTPVITSSGDALHSSAAQGNQWFNQDGPIEGAMGQDFLALEPGIYYVIVTEGDCVSAPSNSIELITVSLSTAISPDRTRLYPNPAAERIYLSGPVLSNDTKYTLRALDGKIIRSEPVVPADGIPVSQLLPGIYFLVLEGPQGRETLRFSKT